MRDEPPLAYLITFTCYDTWLHGHQRGSVDRSHNEYGQALVPEDLEKRQTESALMRGPSYSLDERHREVVLRVLREVCEHRGWGLLAAHVRSTHVHLVVSTPACPERVMNDVKAYASRALNQTGWDPKGCARWTRHGSTRYLWKEEHVVGAVRYVVEGQGKPMAVYSPPTPSEPRPLGSG